MNETRTLIHEPLFQITENFLTSDECHSLITIADKNLKNSTIINGITGIEEISTYRTSNNYDLSQDHELSDIIYGRISDKLGIDRSRFEPIEVIKYKTGEFFNNHCDFFSSTTEKKHFVKGGQRVGTVIMYLNEVERGGETFFPSLRLIEKPVIGKMAYFKYDYDNDINMKTIHKGMPVESGEKWIATVWIREFARTQLCEDYVIEHTSLNDVEYELNCSVTQDTRTLSIILPRNSEPENTVMVVVTSNPSSMLLLYLITSLNFHQTIPYNILPIVIGNISPDNLDSIHTIVDNIKTRTTSEYLLNMEIYNQSLDDIFIEKLKDRFYKLSYIFVERPTKISSHLTDVVISPFDNLLIDHITWALDELNISDIISQINR